jgi:hypothetical protein
MKNTEVEKLLDRTALSLYEQGFDSVEILVTWMEGGHTKSLKKGAGNWYARQHMAAEFISEEITRDNACKIAEALDNPDDGDAWKAEKAT